MPIEVKAGEDVEHNFRSLFKRLKSGSLVLLSKSQMERSTSSFFKHDYNVVSAERIRELPDASAAAALSRLPGVSLMNGDQVVIREFKQRTISFL